MKIEIPKEWIMARTEGDEGEIGAGSPAALMPYSVAAAMPKSAAQYAVEAFERIMTLTTNYKIHLHAQRAIKRLRAAIGSLLLHPDR